MLIKIFSQKLIFSNVILAFLDHLKHKIFFNHGGQHRAPPLFKVSGSAPEHVTFTALSTTKNTCFTEHFITSYFCPMNIAKFLRTAFLQNTSRSSVCRCSSNQVFLKFSQTSQESTCEALRLKACNNVIKKKSPIQVFSFEVCKIFKNTFFYRTPPVTACALPVAASAFF